MMTQRIIYFLVTAALLCGCNIHSSKPQTTDNTLACGKENKADVLTREEIKHMSFEELFDTINVRDIKEDVFTLVGENYGILTAGTPDKYNSMVTSWGGWGLVFGKPGMFHFLRSNRYTLELMREQKTYTVSFFDDEYMDDIMQFGMKSGRDSDKMKETKLTAVQTPEGNPAYKEAKIILECRLAEVTSVSPDDFYNDEDRAFVTKAYSETGDWHKVVFSQIINAWTRK
ncbi:MAG: flavin reductase family protein [Prevotella sp.]